MEDNQTAVCNLWEVGRQENELICSSGPRGQAHRVLSNSCGQACEG